MLQLFLNDHGVLDHGDAATLSELAFHSDAFATIFGELIVDWLVFSNHQICFALADDTDRSTTLDALCPAGLAMFFADGIMIDIAHHIDHFAGHFFRSGRITAVLVLLCDGERSNCQRGYECRNDRDPKNRGFVCYRIKHKTNLGGLASCQSIMNEMTNHDCLMTKE